MPRTVKTVAGYYTGAGAGTGVATPSPGGVGNFTVDAFQSGNCYLESIWAAGADTDFIRVRSGRMHDSSQGIRLRAGATAGVDLLPFGNGQKLFSNDNLTVEIDVTAAATGGIALTYGFDDLNGGNQSIATWSDVQSRIVEIMGQEVDVTSGAIGTWGAAVALDADEDNWKAGFQYALLGYTCQTACLALAVNGANTSGQDIGFPGSTDAFYTQDRFIRMAEKTGRQCIPIIDGNNKGSTTLKSVDVAGATVSNVTLILARLA